MLDREEADKYANHIGCGKDIIVRRLLADAYTDGYQLCESKYAWHDYKANPKDVPDTERFVVLETVQDMYAAKAIFNPDGSFYGFTTGLGIFVPQNIIRWKEIEV